MKCVIDTNLAVSSLISPGGPPAGVLQAWREGGLEWVSCIEQIDELFVTLTLPRIYAKVRGGLPVAKQLIQEIEKSVALQALVSPIPAICRDPKDDYLFALFDQGHADWIISGDKDVVALKGRYPVLTPRELIDRL